MSTDHNQALRAAAQQALETLEQLQGGCTDSGDGTVEAITVWCPEVIDALRAALAQPAASAEPAADARWCVEWIRNNYQAHTTIAGLCDAMLTASWKAAQPAPALVPLTHQDLLDMRR